MPDHPGKCPQEQAEPLLDVVSGVEMRDSGKPQSKGFCVSSGSWEDAESWDGSGDAQSRCRRCSRGVILRV